MLAEIGAPLKLHDGTLVYKDGRVVKPGDTVRQQQMVEIPTHREAQALVVRTRRQVADLPAVPQHMNPINVILVYELFGLTIDEVALACKVTTQQVVNIQASEPYKVMRAHITETVLKAESENVRELFQQKAVSAANEIGRLMTDDSAAVRLAAAKDVLDRAGHRPVDVVDHRHSVDGELRITYVEQTKAPAIDMQLVYEDQ